MKNFVKKCKKKFADMKKRCTFAIELMMGFSHIQLVGY